MNALSLCRAALLLSALAACGAPKVACDELDGRCGALATDVGDSLRAIRARAPRHAEGAPVSLRGVSVSAYDTYDEDGTGRVGNLFVQQAVAAEPGATDRWAPCPLLPSLGVRVCALPIFAPRFSPAGFRPATGDVVELGGGAYTEFTCLPCGREFEGGRFIPQVAQPSVTSAGVAPAPLAIPVTLAELIEHNDALMGNLVTVTDVVIESDPDRYNEVAIGAGVKLAFQMFPSTGFGAGQRLRRVTGIAYYFYGPKLIPRSTADLDRAD